jgi:hypothetical protein
MAPSATSAGCGLKPQPKLDRDHPKLDRHDLSMIDRCWRNELLQCS